ncbi:hypothetical protein AC623_16340 [Bacillus sp. FJAT-27231]|uniref:DUF3021 domain-containing protein n=1 Tax=Bacillus sp. FJAT-27231 TaxID=1679168 RepID=UPI00067100BA|nr:DUF3021 domain-containing protein [Bacillus sp. FJAT-27231]KMY55309.1 hypothetical protein AC623_16340 [Bacillus sp. FJAT-27231]
MKTFVLRSLIGIFFGAFLSVMVTAVVIYVGSKELLEGGLFIKNAFATMFCGWFFSITPLYFEIKSLRLSQQTALHFVTVAVLYFALSLGVGWIAFNIKSVLSFAALFIFMYVIIWVCFYLYFKHEAKKLNDDLRHI